MKKLLAVVFSLTLVFSVSTGALATEVKPACSKASTKPCPTWP